MISGKRIAIFGLGRSGLGIGRAAQTLGAHPTVFDQAAADSVAKQEVREEAEKIGLGVVFGWDGTFPEPPDCLVVNPAVRKDHPILLDAVAAGIEVLSEVEFAYRISRAPIVAITGTNGKTTTTVMTFLALRACGIEPILCGNIFGSGFPEATLTDAALEAQPDQVLVAEVSSFQLEWVSRFEPGVAGITNVWPDHLDRYTDFAEYAATKHRIFAAMGAEDFVVVKANDPVVVPPGARPPGLRRGRRTPLAGSTGPIPTIYTFGATGEHARVDEREVVLLDKRVPLDDLPFSEPHNYQNACMAALLAYSALRYAAHRDPEGRAAQLLDEATAADQKKRGPRSVYAARESDAPRLVLPEAIIDGLKSFTGVAHRMELVGSRDGIRVINNSMCTNPDAVMKSTMALRDPAHLLIGGANKNLDFSPLRNYLANQRHRVYLFGRDREKLNEALGGTYPMFEFMPDAFAAATRNARKGEIIMLAPGCAGLDHYRDFRERGDVFRSIAKEWLEN